ncbi:MAG TPA: serpin family protein [Kofleriaceae bacterium]
MNKYVVLGLLIAGCSGGADDDQVIAERQLPAGIRDDATALAHANNQFAIDLYGQVAAGGGNLCISPYSVSTALGMLDAGAAGASDQELRAALHVDLPGERLHAAEGAILASLDTGRAHGAYTLATANRLYGQQGFPFLPSFLTLTQADYGAPLESVDFAGNSEAARAKINGWVADQTDDKIKELFSSQAISPSTVLALVNALVFKGAWQQQFDHARTETAAFTRADGSTVQATMMHKSEMIAIAAIGGDPSTHHADLLGVLPFRGKDLSMVLLVPGTPGGLPAIEAKLAAGLDLAALVDQQATSESPIEVALPKFSFTSAIDLIEPLSALGVHSVFGAGADLSNIDGARDLSVGTAVHQAFISVDEDGAEAAAATGIGLDDAAPEISSLVADRPFLFAIYDHVTHTILFLGRVSDPSAGG